MKFAILKLVEDVEFVDETALVWFCLGLDSRDDADVETMKCIVSIFIPIDHPILGCPVPDISDFELAATPWH